jgi:hypothetical protein
MASLCWFSVPVAPGSQEAGDIHALQRDASAQDHSCCPRSHPRVVTSLFVTVSFPAMPSGTQHPCCARQAPASPSTMPVETKVARPGMERISPTCIQKKSPSCSRLVEPAAICFLSPPFERSTVLRI